MHFLIELLKQVIVDKITCLIDSKIVLISNNKNKMY